MQLDIGTSIRRYAPPIGTAGLALFFVSGYNLDPAPPPRMTAMTLFVFDLPPSLKISGLPSFARPLSVITVLAVTCSVLSPDLDATERRGATRRDARDATLLFEEASDQETVEEESETLNRCAMDDERCR